MRTTIRTLLAATLLGGFGANAQNTLIIEGTVPGCTPLQQVTVTSQPGTVPAFSWTFDLDPFTCGYDTIVAITSPSAAVVVSTTCNGTTLTDGDTATFNFVNDTVLMVIDLACVGGGTLDCQGVLNGPDLPGTSCDDGDPGTYNDLWTVNCSCVGQPLPGCSADFTIQQLVVNGNPVPWTVTTTNLSTATPPVVYTWWYPNGTQAQTFETQYTFGAAGYYSFSLTLVDTLGCTSYEHQDLMIDTAGMIYTGIPTWDCLGQFLGPAVAGTPCDDNNPMSSNDLWDANCWCMGDTTGTTVDCLGVVGGSTLPGTACDDNNSWTINDLWTGWCVCVGDSIFNTYDCLGILNGPNVPGSACDDNDSTTVNDTWSVWCTCSGVQTLDCQGVPNGPDLPGTACDDGDPGTYNDLWTANCSCIGQPLPGCSADFTIQQLVVNGNPVPWTVTTTNLSTATPPVVYTWWYPNGTSAQTFETQYTFGGAGNYWFSLVLVDSLGCASSTSLGVMIDTTGMIFTGTPTWDCLGQFMGTALPGTPCDDGNPMSSNDLWDANCWCFGDTTGTTVDCLGITGGTALPGTACDDNNSWTTNDLWTGWCVCVGDSVLNTYDCQGILNGPNMPGDTCESYFGSGVFGLWTATCTCDTMIWNTWDCEGILNGPSVAGSPCDDGDPNTFGDLWDANCNCSGQGGGWVDCLGIPNGTAMPGTPCDDGDPNTFNDTWNGTCTCVGSGGLPCEADFIVTQAYDSLQGPIPGTIWVFFLNNGGQGFTYSWDFGDGTTSNVPFPTHTYSGNGPYLLCLTVSGFGCTDTFCDSVGVDANGIILPMGAQSQGFTINVMGGANSIHEAEVLSEVAIAPNPVNDVLTLSLNSTRSGPLLVDVLDVTGKLIHQQRASLITGANTLRLDLSHLEAGSYLVRLNADGTIRTERFVRGY
ncbi:MAG: T9SS type A sorting domain-containing protein [Flavobacteriales bacterium]|nr:T9SS type A sorting domain-containing protein [Flavobacteriales bacterium]MBK9699219.1 T9SS type A sorting domain-containing protein [Flavobacteriales bacterium]